MIVCFKKTGKWSRNDPSEAARNGKHQPKNHEGKSHHRTDRTSASQLSGTPWAQIFLSKAGLQPLQPLDFCIPLQSRHAVFFCEPQNHITGDHCDSFILKMKTCIRSLTLRCTTYPNMIQVFLGGTPLTPPKKSGVPMHIPALRLEAIAWRLRSLRFLKISWLWPWYLSKSTLW